MRKVADVADLVLAGRERPSSVFKQLRALAASEDWAVREVAATALVEISKRQPEAVAAQMAKWAKAKDGTVRRAASEGLREVARRTPDLAEPVLQALRADGDLYVRKSVANVLRNAGNYHPDFVLRVGREWAAVPNANTAWIVRNGLRKLAQRGSREAKKIIARL